MTSCQTCREPLEVSYTGQETHPLCESTESEKLAREFVDAVQRGDEPEMIRLEKALNQPALPPVAKLAMWYAKTAKWPIFPLLPNTKRPATQHGLKDATTNLQQVADWWKAMPEANIGGVTGIYYDVLDIDGPEGFASLRELGPDVLPDVHGRVNTRRGQHLYLKVSGDGNRAGVRPGLDYRGKSGYVLLPGSRIDLHRWTWTVPPSPEIMG